MKNCEYCPDLEKCEMYGGCWNPPVKEKPLSPSDAMNCSPSSTPETEAMWGAYYAGNADEADLAILMTEIERERDEARKILQSIRERLNEIPELVLNNERKNPAWSKAELWAIERDIVPSVRLLCWSAAALIPENVDVVTPRN